MLGGCGVIIVSALEAAAMVSESRSPVAASRRAILTALAAAPLLTAPALAQGEREWDRLLSAYRRAKAACEAHNAAVVEPAWERMEAAIGPRPSMDIAIPATNGQVATFLLPFRELHMFDDAPWIAPHAAKVRDRWLAYEARRVAAETRENWPAIETEGDRLADMRHDAEERLMATPAPDAAAFCVKFVIDRDDDRDSGPWTAIMLEDARRLAGANLI